MNLQQLAAKISDCATRVEEQQGRRPDWVSVKRGGVEHLLLLSEDMGGLVITENPDFPTMTDCADSVFVNVRSVMKAGGF